MKKMKAAAIKTCARIRVLLEPWSCLCDAVRQRMRKGVKLGGVSRDVRLIIRIYPLFTAGRTLGNNT